MAATIPTWRPPKPSEKSLREPLSLAIGQAGVTGEPEAPDVDVVGVDPLTAPLTYPGLPPWRPAVLVTDTEVLSLQPRRDRPLGRWPVGEWTLRSESKPAPMAPGSGAISGPNLLVESDPEAGPGSTADPSGRSVAQDGPLDSLLQAAGGPPTAARTPVLAVGSNASPAQVRRKMANAGLATQVPITAVRVRGLTVGVSAHVSRPGYLPATPVPDPAAESDLWVLWLDAAALDAVDATEPNYRRVRLPARCPVQLTSGQAVTDGWVYLSRHGHLLNAAGQPRRLTDQATLITALLAELPALRELAGTDPEQWIKRAGDPGVRAAVRELFRSAGLVRSAERF